MKLTYRRWGDTYYLPYHGLKKVTLSLTSILDPIITITPDLFIEEWPPGLRYILLTTPKSQFAAITKESKFMWNEGIEVLCSANYLQFECYWEMSANVTIDEMYVRACERSSKDITEIATTVVEKLTSNNGIYYDVSLGHVFPIPFEFTSSHPHSE
jgi:hypothetical protein